MNTSKNFEEALQALDKLHVSQKSDILFLDICRDLQGAIYHMRVVEDRLIQPEDKIKVLRSCKKLLELSGEEQ